LASQSPMSACPVQSGRVFKEAVPMGTASLRFCNRN